MPLLGGSGGAGTTSGQGGGGGGGAILIASDTEIIINGVIDAKGGGGGAQPNAGSAGGVRLVAPVVSGSGTVDVDGVGLGTRNHSGYGRFRVATLDRSGFDVRVFPDSRARTLGSFMVVSPTPLPRLDIISAAGSAIAEGSGPVLVTLPNDSPSTQSVTVQARDFVGLVPIEVVVTPENGTRTVVLGEIDMAGGNPSEVSVNVEIPANTPAHINAWRR